jgi:hypothetical protein
VTIALVSGEKAFEPLNERQLHRRRRRLPDGSKQDFSVYLHATPPGALTDVARNAGPGNDYCDYRGVDDAEACFEALIAAISQ